MTIFGFGGFVLQRQSQRQREENGLIFSLGVLISPVQFQSSKTEKGAWPPSSHFSTFLLFSSLIGREFTQLIEIRT